MTKRAILVLADGSVFEGNSFGAEKDAFGEVVFSTSMTGYQEMLTDPSFAGQILIPTFPLIGNYGVNPADWESDRLQVRGFVVREECAEPSNYQTEATIDSYLKQGGTPGIWGLDTRAITRKLRSHGVMMGMITSDKTPGQAFEILRMSPIYGTTDLVKEVSTKATYDWDSEDIPETAPRVALLDCGCKFNIMRILRHHGCRVTAFPCTATAKEMLAINPDGILLSPGPGDPELLDYATETVRGLVDAGKPIMGICLGNQIVAKAFGGHNFKLKFGHRGGNHPVKDLATGRVHITAQNHGYAVDPESLKGSGLEVTHINLNDGTVEGMRHKTLPIFTIQYHSEASPGPLDNTYLFEQFMTMMGRTDAR
ncbi:glutamine-hydrolyzing carbamoyl-phosphate synthase small subunit [Dehalogenimonas etheniformans]|uniref:Carbamoyl phosphate synthase small chain n=1 Tax=Dehalogenimonas etheniformans TaxID=1536648 RepID=A0A2P5P876_9CHLR|nr:glutamine-hydrolyzing carbamoyl-phosphate synthase small subunit [Dehalogenimonas etheniformans]PPD58494.1 carbamoyl-phosphate synthase small subunit [Dehalogenimonas etheniformans]QNT76742.1 glutamine-hydrolyzing carbamoyl-phosphate synthase small subunit [Dehalogenimonas etheniformans]